MTLGETLPLVNRAMSELSKQYQTRYGLPKGNPFLSPTDFVFNKVFIFKHLLMFKAFMSSGFHLP